MTTSAVRARRRLDDLVAGCVLPGVQYQIVDSRDVRFQYEGARSDLLTGRPVTADTPFMAASSTKVLTAAAVLQLVESGRVRLDDPLTAYYPGHPYGDASPCGGS